MGEKMVALLKCIKQYKKNVISLSHRYCCVYQVHVRLYEFRLITNDLNSLKIKIKTIPLLYM